MAHQKLRCNLSATIFPFATVLGGRTIIVPQNDQNYEKTLVSSADTDKDRGIPQAFYMHNVMPTAQGYQSIGYNQKLAGLTGVTDFDGAFPIQNADQNKFLFVPASGKNYVYDADVGVWASVSPLTGLSGSTIFTTAFVNGQSYLFYSGINCYMYNSTTKVMDVVLLSGLTIANVRGLCAANGYLIAFGDIDVNWSSQTDPTDFVPSLATGAGGGSVAEAKGRIICCLPIAGGFMVYCENNIVAARYTGNARFPYNFKELPGSGGISSPEQVSWQGNEASHYVWSSVGLQKVDTNTCANLVPEISDFLSMKYFEDFDETTLTLSEQFLDVPLHVKVHSVGGRFLVISYGVELFTYTHALVFDLVLKRYGKLKITHRDCFNWNAPNLYGELTYDDLTMSYDELGEFVTYDDLTTRMSTPEYVRGTLAFLQEDGTVKVVEFDLAQTNANGVFMLGKFQFQRNRFITHQGTEIESIRLSLTFNYKMYVTYDGKTLQPAASTVLRSSGPAIRSYGKQLTGQNLIGLYLGGFNLTSVIMDFSQAGEW